MVTVAQLQHQDHQVNQNEEENQNGGQTGNVTKDLERGAVEIRDIDEEGVDYPSDSAGSSSFEEKSYGGDAVCVRSESAGCIRRQIDREDVSHTSSTQYSDIDDSFEGDELGSWSNDLNVPVSLQQHFDNGVSLPISEVPTFGDVSVKNSANVHFGNKTFYNGPVTIKQIVYSNPNSQEDQIASEENNGVNDTDKLPKYSNRAFAEDEFTASGNNDKTTSGSRNSQDDFKVTHWCAWLLTWRCVALMCAMGSCLVASVVVSVVLLSRDSEASQTTMIPEIPESDLDGVTTKLRFIKRVEWGAQPPTETLDKLEHPVPYVIISHTATEPCKSQSECTLRVRYAQTFHIESQGWSDIGYNFLIGGDGYAYVGRGWDSVGAHSYGYNKKSIGISFVGTFNTVVPPKRQLIAAQQLIEFGVTSGKISTDYKLLGHRQVSATLSPGSALYNILTKWPHWSPTP